MLLCIHTMVLTTLCRGAACGAMASASRSRALPVALRFACTDYDWNVGFPGSRSKNPAPNEHDGAYPGLGRGWRALVKLSTATP